MIYIKEQSICRLVPVNGKAIETRFCKNLRKYAVIIGDDIVGKYLSEEKATKAFDGIVTALSENQRIYVMPKDEVSN